MRKQIMEMLQRHGMDIDNDFIEEMFKFICAQVATTHVKAYNEGWEAHIKYASERKTYKKDAPKRMRWIRQYHIASQGTVGEAIAEYDRLYLETVNAGL